MALQNAARCISFDDFLFVFNFYLHSIHFSLLLFYPNIYSSFYIPSPFFPPLSYVFCLSHASFPLRYLIISILSLLLPFPPPAFLPSLPPFLSSSISALPLPPHISTAVSSPPFPPSLPRPSTLY